MSQHPKRSVPLFISALYFILPMSLRFTAKERLKSRKAIGKLFKQKRSVGAFPLRFFYMKTEGEQLHCLQSAFSVSKKHFKKAVDRNRIKRLMREALRLNNKKLNLFLNENNLKIAGMWVFVGTALLTFNEMQKAMLKSLDRLLSELSAEINESDLK
jgi:ribonuclease P protein component